MSNSSPIGKSTEAAMQKAIDHTQHQMGTLHTGKADPQMLDGINVEVYGSMMRLKDIASITTPDARSLRVQPWDKTNLKPIEKAILLANLGINASILGECVFCPIPDLSRERREELVKVANKIAEEGRVSVRNCRQEALKVVKAAKSEGAYTEDDVKRLEKEVQTLTDAYVAKIEQLLKAKTDDLLSLNKH